MKKSAFDPEWYQWVILDYAFPPILTRHFIRPFLSAIQMSWTPRKAVDPLWFMTPMLLKLPQHDITSSLRTPETISAFRLRLPELVHRMASHCVNMKLKKTAIFNQLKAKNPKLFNPAKWTGTEVIKSTFEGPICIFHWTARVESWNCFFLRGLPWEKKVSEDVLHLQLWKLRNFFSELTTISSFTKKDEIGLQIYRKTFLNLLAIIIKSPSFLVRRK